MDPIEHYVWIGKRLGRKPNGSALDAIQSLPFEDLPRHRLKVAIIAWDVGHNPLGRAYMIAQALSPRFEVVLLGPQFDRYGQDIWAPVKHGPIEVISFRGTNYPEFAFKLEKIAGRLDCDVIIACKPRMPSLHLGLLAKRALNRPLILDIDDYELSFVQNQSVISLSGIESSTNEILKEPYSDIWTRFAENLVPYVDDILVSNEALRDKFGGILVPHARDERIYDPALYDRSQQRANLGLCQKDKLVLFAGTARAHKGVVEIAAAIAGTNNPHYKLGILGTVRDAGLKGKISQAGEGHVIFIPDQPFSELPRFLSAADLVCLPQNLSSTISQYQLPAKLIDAISMGIPVLATPTVPIQRFIDQGFVTPLHNEALKDAIQTSLTDIVNLRAEQQARRKKFIEEYSYSSIRNTLESVIFSALSRNNGRKLPSQGLRFQDRIWRMQRRSSRVEESLPARVRKTGRYDVVMFWKQHDTGVYGRRSDMLAKYLSRYPTVRQVLVLDAPLWCEDLTRKGEVSGISEHRLVYKEILARQLGLRDKDYLSFASFVYHPIQRHPMSIWRYPSKEEYHQYLLKLFSERDIQLDRAIFWLFPVNHFLKGMLEEFRPAKIICDIVDDQRMSPGVTAEEFTRREKNYRELLKIADLAITNCAPIQESMRPFRPDIRVLPNGCEIEPSVIDIGQEPDRLAKIPRPRLGYVGNLESKLDLDLLEFVATRRPQWNIVLVGSAHTRSEVLRLGRFPNVHIVGVVKYDEAKDWIRHFDVTLLPHLITPLTKTMNPLKLFVYAAHGKITVSTETPNTAEMNKFCLVSSSYEDFLTNIEKALSTESVPVTNADLYPHSWDARVRTAMDWIDG